MKEETTVSQAAQESDILERFILSIIRLLNRHFKTILLAGLIGGAAGVLYSTTRPKQYTCSIDILPEFNSDAGSGFSSFASLAGIDLAQKSESNAFRPDLYPTVLTSTTAVVQLLREPVKTADGKKFKSLIDYLDHQNTEQVSKKSILYDSTITDPPVWRFDPLEKNIVENVRSRITASFDKKNGIVALSVEMPDPEIAAYCTSSLTTFLSTFLSDYRSKKKHDQTTFLANRVKSAKERLYTAEMALQSYRDRNRNVVSNVAQIQEQKLQFEFMQRQGVHNDLVNQLEKSRLEELQKEDILITVESPIVPLRHSSPRRLMYALGGAIAFVGLLFIVMLKPWKLFLRS